MTSVPVYKGINSEINLVLEKDANLLLKKGDDINIEQNLEINDNIIAPLSSGDILGKVTYTLNNEKLLEVNLVSELNVQKNTLWNITTTLYNTWFNMIR